LNTSFPCLDNFREDSGFNARVFMNDPKPERHSQLDRFFGKDSEGQSNKVVNNRQPGLAAAANETSGLSKQVPDLNKRNILAIDTAPIDMGKSSLQTISGLGGHFSFGWVATSSE
jgi:hypothetical protein